MSLSLCEAGLGSGVRSNVRRFVRCRYGFAVRVRQASVVNACTCCRDVVGAARGWFLRRVPSERSAESEAWCWDGSRCHGVWQCF